MPDVQDTRRDIPLQSPDLIAVNALGQFADHPRVAALREFITGWYVSYLSIDNTRGQPEAGPQERLSRSGDNLANVIQYLGLSFQQTDLAGKRLELLREVVPALRRLAILANAGNPVTPLDMRDVEAAAGTLGLTVVTVEIRRMEDIAPGFRGG